MDDKSSGFKFDSMGVPWCVGEAPMCFSIPWVREARSLPRSPAPGEVVDEVGEESPSLFFVLGNLWSFFWKCYKKSHEKEIEQKKTLKFLNSGKISFILFCDRINLGKIKARTHFILLFWNHIFIWRSVKHNEWAISIRLRRVKYRLKWNSFSSSKIWCLV